MKRVAAAETPIASPGQRAPEGRTRVVARPRDTARSANQIITTPVGLQIPPGLGYDKWAKAGPKISGLLDTFAWCLGDWLVYGQDRFEARYAAAVEKVGLDYQTLRNYAWVARKFEVSRRRSGLSFQHHAEVASRPPDEQDAWLDGAERHGWSRSELRRRLRQPAGADDNAPVRQETFPQLQIEPARLARWRVAAANARTDLSSWIVSTLDQAAAQPYVSAG